MNNPIVRPFDLSYTSPIIPPPHISRPKLVQAMVDVFNGGTDVICIEATSGCGKTALAQEFASSVDHPSFATFLRSASRLSYDPVTARADLANQVYWFLTSRRLPDDDEPTDGTLRDQWAKCARRLVRQRMHAYVIVDGIHHIPKSEGTIKHAILDLLPFGMKPFRFVLTCNNESDLEIEKRGLRTKSILVPRFGPHETAEFLKDVVSDKDKQLEYYNVLDGVPLLLACVRRHLQNSPNEFDVTSYSNIASIFDAQWQEVAEAPPFVSKAIAHLVAHGRSVPTDLLARSLSMGKKEIYNALSSVPFLVCSDETTGWDFVPELFRELSEKRLSAAVAQATSEIVTDLLERPDSDDSIARLPLYLDRVGEAEKLLEWLDEEHLATALFKTRTAATIDPTLQSAANLSHDGRNDRALMTFSLDRSIVRQISQSTGVEPEIRARIALGDVDGALAIANDAPLLTQRLRHLSVAASSLGRAPGFAVQPLLDDIAELCRQLDVVNLPSEDVIDIATDVYPIHPDLALGLLRETTQGDIEDASFEMAVARVTISAMHAAPRGDDDIGGQPHEPIPKNLLVDRKLKRLLQASSAFHHAKSATELLESTDGIDDPTERLYIRRKWISNNPLRTDVLEVVDRVLGDAIKLIEFSPTATFYREVSMPLPYAKDRQKAREIVAVIDGQALVVVRKGPLVDFVRLQLCLAMCDYVDGDIEGSSRRLEDLYLDSIEDTEELQERVTSLAWVISEMCSHDPSGKLAQRTQVGELVEEEFEKGLKTILSEGADHLDILVDALGALAVHNPELALSVCKRMNTVDRRNRGIRHCITAISGSTVSYPDYRVLFEMLDAIESGTREKDLSFEEIGERIARDVAAGSAGPATVNELLNRSKECCSSSALRAIGLARITSAMTRRPEFEHMVHDAKEETWNAFESIAGVLEKYRVACDLIDLVYESAPDLGERVLGYLKSAGGTVNLSEEIESGTLMVLNLLCKACHGLASSGMLREEDLKEVCDLIRAVDDRGHRIHLLSLLAFFLWKEKETGHFTYVVNREIWPLLSAIGIGDPSCVYSCWREAYPVVWIDDRDRARSGIAEFPVAWRNACTSALCFALLNRQPVGEPFETSGGKGPSMLEYEDIQMLLQLCEETDEDSMIFLVFERIADDVTGRRRGGELPRVQKAEISRRMVEIAENRLPVARRIAHDGYQIVCKAQGLRIHESNEPSWQKLLKEGRAIENSADRAYVLAYLATSLPKKQGKLVRSLLEEVESETAGLATMTDRYGRYSILASLSLDNNWGNASKAIERAFESVVFGRGRGVALRESHLVDLAYRVDPELPMKLAAFYDDDPAREEYRRRAGRRILRRELRAKIADSRNGGDLKSMKNDPNLPSASWQALGALNSGRMIAVEMGRLRDMLLCASDHSLSNAFPMYSWVLTNVSKRYGATAEAKAYVRDAFEGVLQATRFFFRMTKGGGFAAYREWRDLAGDRSQAMIGVGDREKALNFLRTWIRDSAEEEVVVIDAYFRPGDLELLTLVMEANVHLKVRIFTGKRAHKGLSESPSDAYTRAWRGLCDQVPPETEVTIVSTGPGGDAPFHDRWMLSRSVGLRIGTSFSSLGNKVSEISILDSDEVGRIRSNMRPYLAGDREHQGERIAYESFDLLG